ncbi:MAG: CaiB/BaiF CoA transferase family protein [Nocardioidaceae bacterium]
MRPLEDVRIVAVEQYGAGPYGSLHLADLGAEVIKIEDPSTAGDVGRSVPPFREGDSSLFFETFNRNKRSVAVDLGSTEGRAVLKDLVAVSDAVYSNLRGDVPEKLGITYRQLAEVNPRIVCCSLSGFGMTGPRRTQAGYDYILQGLTGWMALAGEPDGPPTKTGPSLVDYSGGLVAALSLVVGVHAARRDGVGMDCDVSLFDTALGLIGYPATWWLHSAYEVQRRPNSSHPSLVPFGNFATADGWIVVACPKEKFWQRLCAALGRPELATDATSATFEARRDNPALMAELEASFAAESTSYWLEHLADHGVPCGPVNSLPDALSDPHVEARNMLLDVPHPAFGDIREVASPVHVGEGESPTRRAPSLGEDTGAVLGGIVGYDDSRLAALAEAGVIALPSGQPGVAGPPGPPG